MPRSKHLWVILIGLVILLLLALSLALKDNAKTVSASMLENALQKNLITKIWEKDEHLYAQSKDTQIYKILLSQVDPLIIKSMPIDRDNSKWLAWGIGGVLVLLVCGLGLAALILTRKNRLHIAPLNANELKELESSIAPLHSSIRFSDVAGIEEVKSELLEIVDFLRYPQKYQAFRVSLPRGVLLAGAPGVGKTLLAKALAGESGVPFFYQSGASFVEMYVGVGARRVRELFSRAKASAPCIIFIDEIDAIGRARKEGGQNGERESTLNQLLIEMDGFSDNSGVVVLAATNHIEVLDPALLRSGRFDRKLFIELPNKQEREQILRMYLSSKPHNLGEQVAEIARETAGFSGAALATLVNEAALNAIRNRAPSLCKSDFDALYTKIQSGLKRLPLLESRLREVYATYQASKFLYAKKLGLPIQKATLFTVVLRDSSAQALSTSELGQRICFHLVGDRALRLMRGESYGVFGEDYHSARALLLQGRRLGLLSKQEVRALSLALVPESRLDSPLESPLASGASPNALLQDFITKHQEEIGQLSALLLQAERLELPEEASLSS